MRQNSSNIAPYGEQKFKCYNFDMVMKAVRILLLFLIIIGLVLIAGQSFWVPGVVNAILQHQEIQQEIPRTNTQTSNIKASPKSQPSVSLISATTTILDLQKNLPNDTYHLFAKDKNYVYLMNSVNNVIQPRILYGIDPSTFRIITNGDSKDCGNAGAVIADKNGFYLQTGQKFEGAVDETTFVALGLGFFKDKNHVWGGNLIQPALDPKTYTPSCGPG